MRHERRPDQQHISDLPVSVASAARVPAPGTAAPAPALAPRVPDATVLRVYTRVGGPLDGTCPLGV
ncbi:hypothetical protein [Urbifossiella limnaea]|uniref:hypothetical protein n=1 Tax=Urbifossiella limnaea TaxID=2528023 RepID=UPI0011A57955|nr:hypothetical protein [Urbifossiella limnaea]